MDFLTATTNVPIWFPVAAILLGTIVGMGGLMTALRLLSSRETATSTPPSNGGRPRSSEVPPAPVPKPEPPPKPLTKREQSDLERLLTRATAVRTHDSHSSTATRLTRPVTAPTAPDPIAVAVTKQQTGTGEKNPVEAPGVPCKFCKKVGHVEITREEEKKNGRLLRYFRCGDCGRRFVNWVS